VVYTLPRPRVEIHRTLMTATTHAHIVGVVRTSQNWIGGNNHPRGAEFIRRETR
jgi:hypothetical protein